MLAQASIKCDILFHHFVSSMLALGEEECRYVANGRGPWACPSLGTVGMPLLSYRLATYLYSPCKVQHHELGPRSK